MLFKHKLSKRLALIRDCVIAGTAVAVLACELDQPLAPRDPRPDVRAAFPVITAARAKTTSKPARVTDLAVGGVTDTSVTLTFTEVKDGAGRPASYDVRFAAAPISWGTASPVSAGTCKTPVAGSTIGASRSCTVLGLRLGTSYDFQLVAFRGTLDVNAVFGALSNIATGRTSAPPVTDPGTVTDLAVASVTDNSVTLSFTEVHDGSGQAASYDVRFAPTPISWGSATQVAAGTCSVPMGGISVGARRTCTILGLQPLTSYQFQLVSFRGTLDVNAVFGGLSNIASGTSGSSSPPPPPPPPPVPPPPPPPPPPVPGGWPNEPTGFTVVEETGWESGTLGNWYRIFQSSDKPITTEPLGDSPLGETRTLQIGYHQGHVGGGGTELRYDIPSAQRRSEIYVGYYVQVNPQWQGHSSGINKMIYLHDGGPSFSAMWYEMFGFGSGTLDLYVVNQSGSGPAGMRENINQVTFPRGQWHRVEIYQRQGAAGNGIVRVWVNGVLAIDRSDVDTRDTPVDNITISGIWGGVGDSKDHFDFMRFDRIRISIR